MMVKLLCTLVLLPLLINNPIYVHCQHDHREKHRQSLMRVWHTPMEIDVRSMHRYCMGECFYSPDSCRQTLADLNCKNIVAIKKFVPTCNNESPDSPFKDLCERVGHLFIISLLRNLPPELVALKNLQSYKSYDGKTYRCTVKPFVAISFSGDNDGAVTPTDVENGILGDVFYTCVAGDQYVTTWIKRTKPLDNGGKKAAPYCIDISAEEVRKENELNQVAVNQENNKRRKRGKAPPPTKIKAIEIGRIYTQLRDTNPYPPMGSSVLWSQIRTVYEQYAIGCKFIISDLDDDLTIYLNGDKGGSVNPRSIKDDKKSGKVQSPLFFNKKIKIANGLAYSKDGMVENVIFGSTPAKAIALADVMDDANIHPFDGMSNWDLPSLEVETLPPESVLQEERNQLAMSAINDTYQMCKSNKAMCFVRGDERNCILKKGCHYLTAVRSLDSNFTLLRFYMLSQTVKREGIFSWIHPQGWSSIGFSNDTKMGKDLVFTCSYVGETNNVDVTYNLDQQNVKIKDNDWIRGPIPQPIQFYLDMHTETAMCVFDFETSDVIIRSWLYAPSNADLYLEKTWPKLHWCIQRHDFYILLAQGTSSYEDGRISYHTYSTVSPIKFSKERYWEFLGNGSSRKTLKPLPQLLLKFVIIVVSNILFIAI